MTLTMHDVMTDPMFARTDPTIEAGEAGMGGTVESGELVIREKSAGRALSTSLFSRWVSK